MLIGRCLRKARYLRHAPERPWRLISGKPSRASGCHLGTQAGAARRQNVDGGIWLSYSLLYRSHGRKYLGRESPMSRLRYVPAALLGAAVAFGLLAGGPSAAGAEAPSPFAAFADDYFDAYFS